MRRLINIFLILLTIPFVVECSDNDYYDELPPAIAEFVSEYFPNPDIDSYSHSGNVYHVRIKKGPGMTFGSDMNWEIVNGYGSTLPQNLLFDQLPPILFQYLNEIQSVNSVYAISRNPRTYIITTLENNIIYDIETGGVTEQYIAPA